MKNKARLIIAKLIEWLDKIGKLLATPDKNILPYTPLTPIKDAEIEGHYKNALDWALKNRRKNDIRNIAITGPYGSGKSSILKTYCENCNYNLDFLNISLATFKEEEENVNQKTKEDLLRLIELSILQQIFYREKDSKIPDSRFKRIKSFGKRALIGVTIAVLFLLLSIVHQIDSNLIWNLLKTDKHEEVLGISLHYISLISLSLILAWIIYRSIRVFNGIQINRIQFQNAEINVGDNIGKSILNHHLDEILYFFEVTDYNVVIFEDLDRFKQTEIFTKLRELNLLLNNSKKIKREIVFIYAVRDDMFNEENEKTKFFDFIIPVIPVINPSNSSQKLIEKRTHFKVDLSEDLIDTISLFIDDMRLLHNISNEFYLYQQKLNIVGVGLIPDNLMAIIVYKNLFPTDFTLLSNNKGVLFNIVNKKQKFVVEEELKLEVEIQTIKMRIRSIEDVKITDSKELRYLYILNYISTTNDFSCFSIQGDEKSITDMALEENFKQFQKDKVNYRPKSNNSTTYGFNVTFKDVEKRVSGTYNYNERLKQIDDWSKNKIEVLKQGIFEIEKKKSRIRRFKLRELLKEGYIEIEIENDKEEQKKGNKEKQEQLLKALLLNGFIDENYIDYISIFYEESITKTDFQFILNVKSRISTQFDWKVNKIGNVLKKLNPIEFEDEYVLNYSLVDFILEDSLNYTENIEKIFYKLSDESNTSIKFIDTYINHSKANAPFISSLVSSWEGIWTFLEKKSDYPSERKDKYFKLIVEHAKLPDLEKLYNDKSFKDFLLDKKGFLGLIPDIPRTIEVIRFLKIKFKALDRNESPKELIDFLFDENFYEINIDMLKLVLDNKGVFDQHLFDTQNYGFLIGSGSSKLLNYIESNIDDYIERVYLKLPDNLLEREELLIRLLSNEMLSFDNKLKIIEKTKTLIEDIYSVQDTLTYSHLLHESKISATWDNLLSYCESENWNLTESIFDFLNDKKNALKLSKNKIEWNDDENIEKFMLGLIQSEKLNDECYDLILKSIPIYFSSVNLKTLSREKMVLMIRNDMLVFNKENFDVLKSEFHGLHLFFLEMNNQKFLEEINEYNLEPSEVNQILNSRFFTIVEKDTVLNTLGTDHIALSESLLSTISSLISQGEDLTIKRVPVNKILGMVQLPTEIRINVFISKERLISHADVTMFLVSLGEPYSEIAINGKRPLLIKSTLNQDLVSALKHRGYISKFEEERKGIRVSTFKKHAN